MEKLIKNISKLIARNDCVIIPGIGAFLAHEVPASYNAEDKMFMPPHRALLFNPNIKVDDMLLLSEYLAGGKYSYSEALSSLSKDIADFKKTLSDKGTFRFGELGTFSMNVKGEFSFVPNPNGIDDPYNFGFEPLPLPLLSDLEEKEIVISHKSIRKYIAIAATIAVAFFLIAPFANNMFSSADMQASIADISVSAKTVEVCEGQEPATVVPASATVTVQESVVTEEPVMILESEAKEKFHIVVACFQSEKKAKMSIEEFKLLHNADYKVLGDKNRYRVIYGSFATSEDAYASLSAAKAVFADAWVYSI